MVPVHVDPGLLAFSQSGYEVMDRELDSRREVAIRAEDRMAPRLGDLFTVESRGVAHEVAVVQLSTFKGGWRARCRVTDVF